jgi:hypothetical protein
MESQVKPIAGKSFHYFISKTAEPLALLIEYIDIMYYSNISYKQNQSKRISRYRDNL